MNKLFSIFGAALFFALSAGCQQDDVRPTADSQKLMGYTPNFVLAKTNSELRLLQQDPKTNFVRSGRQLEALIGSKSFPLARLPKAIVERFVSRLNFREGTGATSIEFGEIKAALSYEELAQVLAAFGLDIKQGYWGLSQDPAIIRQLQLGGNIQANTSSSYIEEPLGEDFKGAKCENHSCVYAPDSICLASCS